MKQILLILTAVALVGCGENRAISEWKEEKEARAKAAAEAKEQSAIVEKAIRESLGKPEGELTKADLDKVTSLNLHYTQITDAGLNEVAKLKNLTVLDLPFTQITDACLKEAAKMQQLEELNLNNTQITSAGVAELQKALPKCKISSDHD